MYDTEDTLAEYTMLALEPPQSQLLPGRRVDKLDRDRFISVRDFDMKDKRSRNYNKIHSQDYSRLRDGAVNRTIEAPKYKKASKSVSSQDYGKPVRAPWEKDYPKPRVGAGILGYSESGGLGLKKKKSRLNGYKKSVLNDPIEAVDDPRPNRSRQNPDWDSSQQRDVYGDSKVPERLEFGKNTWDSSSCSEFSTQQMESERSVKRLTSANRPKSAGQAMYQAGQLSDSDDSFYDGEIEVVDLDDPVFAYEREFEEAKNSRNAPKSNRPSASLDVNESDSAKTLSPRTGYHDDIENMNKQTLESPESGFGLSGERPQSDRYYDPHSQPRPTTSHGRRRVQSEPDIERASNIPVRTKARTPKQTLDNKIYNSNSVMSGSLYTNSVDKVILKYSGLTVKKSASHYPGQTSIHASRIDTQPARAPLPRKLKPISRREKIGHSTPTSRGEIDYKVSH